MRDAVQVPPGAPHEFDTIESHTAGNPTRTIVRGAPELRGATMLERLDDLRARFPWIRTALCFEPRGHSVMSGCVLQEPCDPTADVGVVFIETSGYPPMCGHDTIGLVTVLIETGRFPAEGPLVPCVLDTPAGIVRTEATVEGGRVTDVAFLSTPSFLLHRDVAVELDGLAPFQVDVAWGGNFYAIVEAADVGVDVRDPRVAGRIALAERIREHLNARLEVVHPVLEGVRGISHVQFNGPPTTAEAHTRSSVIMPPGGADRSPCGTGTSARTAALVARGRLALGETLVHESITGGLFRSTPVEALEVGGIPAVRNRISGRAFITGRSTFIIDPTDPLAAGFLVI